MARLAWVFLTLPIVLGQLPAPPPNNFPPPGAPLGPPVGPITPVGPLGPPGTNNFSPELLEWRCPQHWVQFQGSCYRFIKSPLRPRHEARRNCQVSDFTRLTISYIGEIYMFLCIVPKFLLYHFPGIPLPS